VHLDDGTVLPYGELVIATGVAPRRLPAGEHDSAHVLRTLDDLRALRSTLTTGTRLVVIGGGFLGLEVAATARELGVHVTVVEPLEAPLDARLGRVVARRLLALHERHGVDVRTGVGVARIVGGGIELTDGRAVDADVLLMAIGCQPELGWVAGSGLTIDDGILCDDRCRAADHVWAAGDIARWHHPRLGRHIRVEHRANASEQGRLVAVNIMGADEAYAPIPSFWTDHFDVKVQLMGVIPEGAHGTLVEGEPDGNTFAITFDDPESGAPVGVVGWNAMRQLMRYRKQIAERW
jgi:3-phenylpropionate/trans-cinnamate dioxygenase ferredoxin reductase subunit